MGDGEGLAICRRLGASPATETLPHSLYGIAQNAHGGGERPRHQCEDLKDLKHRGNEDGVEYLAPMGRATNRVE